VTRKEDVACLVGGRADSTNFLYPACRTELCLSEQLETSASASEIIQELHQLEPKSWCQIFSIWLALFVTSLTPNIGLAFGDIFSDAYLVIEYHANMMNVSR